MRYTSQQAKEVIDEILNLDYEPNDWEQKFLENMEEWEGNLSPKQSECLFRIYEKATSKEG